MSLVNNIYAQVLRPLGEVSTTPKFVVFVPPAGADYYPVLLHCDYKNISKATHNLLKHILEGGIPPIIVITEGNQVNIAMDVISYLRANEIDKLFNGVISMNNERFGFLHGFSTFWDNLPFQLEEDLAHIKELGKYTHVGNGFAEAIGSLLNKPTISTHFCGCEQDYMDIKEFLSVMSSEYPDYNYTKAADKPGNFKIPASKNRCKCCHKRGDNLVYFATIGGKLCPTCITKMKERKGGVNVFNWYRLGVELSVERINSRSANLRRMWQKTPTCTECGGKLTPQGFSEYHCDACGHTLWYKHNYYYRIVEYLGKKFVHKISDDGKSLAGSWPLIKGTELIECDECRHVAVEYTAKYEVSTNTTRLVCKRCRAKGF